jgi:hypothetical protein
LVLVVLLPAGLVLVAAVVVCANMLEQAHNPTKSTMAKPARAVFGFTRLIQPMLVFVLSRSPHTQAEAYSVPVNRSQLIP